MVHFLQYPNTFNELHHTKTGLKIFVIVSTDYIFIVSAIPKEGLSGLVPSKASFGKTMGKMIRPVLA